MLLRMKAGAWPDIAKMQQTIRDAGYQPIEGGIDLVVTGKVVRQGDKLLVELDKMKSPAALTVVPAKENPDTAEHLQRHLGNTVELEGRWQPPSDSGGRGGIEVTAIYGADDKRR